MINTVGCLNYMDINTICLQEKMEENKEKHCTRIWVSDIYIIM